jgi:hypothetical protein
MQLVDRYLQEVKEYLPAEQRDDILKELSANILAEMDDREAALGRALSEEEQIAVLQQQGSPMLVASRYRTDQRTLTFGRVLIGPVLFPLYTKILALNLTITIVVTSIVMSSLGLSVGLKALFLPALLQFLTITAIFTLIEQSQKSFHFLDRWNPRALPPVRDPLKISRGSAFSGILSNVIFILCWLRVPGAIYAVGYLFVGPAIRYVAPISASPLVVAPSWQIFYLPVLILVLLSTAQHGLNFAFPRWTRNRLLARAALGFLGLLLTLLLFGAGNLLVPNPAVTTTAELAALAAIINLSVHYSLLIAAVITLFQIVTYLRRALRLPASPSATTTASLAI